jgi:hypothetical protein
MFKHADVGVWIDSPLGAINAKGLSPVPSRTLPVPLAAQDGSFAHECSKVALLLPEAMRSAPVPLAFWLFQNSAPS